MRVPRTIRTAMCVVLPMLAAACMGAFPTEIPPTPGATHADQVMSGGAPSKGWTVTTPARRDDASGRGIVH